MDELISMKKYNIYVNISIVVLVLIIATMTTNWKNGPVQQWVWLLEFKRFWLYKLKTNFFPHFVWKN